MLDHPTHFKIGEMGEKDELSIPAWESTGYPVQYARINRVNDFPLFFFASFFFTLGHRMSGILKLASRDLVWWLPGGQGCLTKQGLGTINACHLVQTTKLQVHDSLGPGVRSGLISGILQIWPFRVLVILLVCMCGHHR